MPEPVSGASDAELVERVRRGDAAAFDVLVRRYFRLVYSIAYAQLAHAADAEDASQDAFIAALERLDDCRNPARFAAWLAAIARNRAINARESRRVRTGESLEDADLRAEHDSSADAERGDLHDKLREALATLNERQREVVILHDLDGRDHREIAGMLGISEVNSRQLLFVARQALRERIGRDVLTEYAP